MLIHSNQKSQDVARIRMSDSRIVQTVCESTVSMKRRLYKHWLKHCKWRNFHPFCSNIFLKASLCEICRLHPVYIVYIFIIKVFYGFLFEIT